MVNALIALQIDEKQRFKKQIEICKKSINRLIVENKNDAYCQPCVSPVWDTGWMGHVLMEKGNENVKDIVTWFLKKEIKINGDWSFQRKNVNPGGWAFQFNNDYYPDVDDTALVGMFLDRYNRKEKNKRLQIVLREQENGLSLCSQKMEDGGAFDIDNDKYYLNYIPFADHGALLDPPTVDVSARCLSFLIQQNDKKVIQVFKRLKIYFVRTGERWKLVWQVGY